MTAIIAKVDNARINRLEIFIPEGASLRGSYAESGDLLVLIIDGKQEVTRLSGKAIHIVRVLIN